MIINTKYSRGDKVYDIANPHVEVVIVTVLVDICDSEKYGYAEIRYEYKLGSSKFIKDENDLYATEIAALVEINRRKSK